MPWGCVRKIRMDWEDFELFGSLISNANADVWT